MNTIERHWDRTSVLTVALMPLSAVFAIVAWLRRTCFRLGVFRSCRLDRPVVVVGNVTAGGTGKTPLVAWLAHRLAALGHTPGVITRGYGGTGEGVCEVRPDSDALACGDEAVLLARRTGCPVWRGADRVAAARALLARHPECDCIISDDGLQHYRLRRDVEIAVVDGARAFGNGLPLPAGPLREPVSRLESVDAIVINGAAKRRVPRGFAMRLQADRLVNMVEPHRTRPLTAPGIPRVHAVAGIGHPPRFFDTLTHAGLDVVEHAFPDHHRYRPDDLEFGDDLPVVMTEKDAVKCFRFAKPGWWYVPVAADVDEALVAVVLERTRTAPASR